MDFTSWPAAEKRGAIAAVAVLVLGLCLAGLVINVMKGDSATFIALMVIAVIVYGVVSGKIQEFSAPGGWSAKFQEVAKQKVGTTAIPITADMKVLQPVPKGGLQTLQRIIPTLPRGKPIALILFFGRRGYQVISVVKKYFEELRLIDPNMVVIFCDKNDRFYCMIEGSTFIDLLNSEKQALIDAINDGDANYLQRINSEKQGTAVIFKALTKSMTNADALRAMKELNIKTMTVVDETNRAVAIVRRDEIVAHLFEELAVQ